VKVKCAPNLGQTPAPRKYMHMLFRVAFHYATSDQHAINQHDQIQTKYLTLFLHSTIQQSCPSPPAVDQQSTGPHTGNSTVDHTQAIEMSNCAATLAGRTLMVLNQGRLCTPRSVTTACQ